MIKHILAFVLLVASAFGTTVTGTTKDPSTGNLFNGSISFTLNYNGARQISTNQILITPRPAPLYTVNNGQFGSVTVVGNDDILPTKTVTIVAWYDPNGALVRSSPYYISGTTFDLGSAVPTPITTSNVSFLDLLGLRNISATGIVTFTGTAFAKTFEYDRYADQFSSITAAWNDIGINPGTVKVPPAGYTTTSTITVGHGQHLIGTSPCTLTESSQTPCGAVINWAGAINTPVIRVHDASGASVEGITVNCANIVGCIAFQYDSDNSPSSTNSSFINISALGFHYGFVNGLASTTADTNGFQADTFTVHGFQFYGNCSDATSIGFLINSANAAQHSKIEQGNIQCVNQGVRGVKSNGYMEFRRFNGGSPIGASPTFAQFDANFGPYLMENVETEGAWSFPIHDSTAISTPNNSSWRFSFFGTSPAGQVLVDGNALILSFGNQGTNTTWATGGTASILSINEAIWTPSASVTTFSTAGLQSIQTIVSRNLIQAQGANCSVFPAGSLPGDLSSCENSTTHAGRLYLGTDLILLNNGDGRALLPAAGTKVQAGFSFIETTSQTGAVNNDVCQGDSTNHFIKCNYNNGNNFHPLRTSEVGTCTMVAGTCTVTWLNAYNVTPIVSATWNGTGAFTTGASLKCVSSTTNAVCTSSTGTDTAVIMVTGVGNPN